MGSLVHSHHKIHSPVLISSHIPSVPLCSKEEESGFLLKANHSSRGLQLLLLSQRHNCCSYHAFLLHYKSLPFYSAIYIIVEKSSSFSPHYTAAAISFRLIYSEQNSKMLLQCLFPLQLTPIWFLSQSLLSRLQTAKCFGCLSSLI